MFRPAQYRAMYDRVMSPLGQNVTLQVKHDTGYAQYTVRAHVSNWREADLIPNGSIKLGDLRLIIQASSLPAGLRRLEQKDRVLIDGRIYGIVNWDANTRTVGDELIAIEATVRG